LPFCLAFGNVYTTFWTNTPTSSNFDSQLTWSSYPNSWTLSGYNDDMITLKDLPITYYLFRMQAMFVAPTTGWVWSLKYIFCQFSRPWTYYYFYYFVYRWYHFAASCNEQCIFYIGSSEASKQSL